MSNFKIYINPRDDSGAYTSFIDVSQDVVETSLSNISQQIDNDEYDVGLKIDHLLDDVKKMIMVPFSSLFDGFHKMIRDLAKDLNKKTELKLVGEK